MYSKYDNHIISIIDKNSCTDMKNNNSLKGHVPPKF